MTVEPDAWNDFRAVTAARIALGRAGASLPTRELLDFGVAHAQARDAVLQALDSASLAEQFQTAGLATICVETAAKTRDEYLRRPDLGRRLSKASRACLHERTAPCDLAVTVSDGLSARALEHAPAVIIPLVTTLRERGWTIGPVIIARHGRVALQDEIGELLQARLSLMVLGERPGLGAADSLGAYIVYAPRTGRTDADRNCVSNIRPPGLPPEAAVATLLYLLTAARERRLSGVGLKDERLLPVASTRIGLMPE